MILVLLIGGNEYIEGNIYLVYKRYCQLGDYMLPTTFYKNLKNLLRIG